MLDFTSLLYLDFRHSKQSLRPWSQLTTGVPAALAEPAGSRAVAGRLAQVQGCEAAVLAPSTLHLFWDLFIMLAEKPLTIYLDRDAYPIAGWGVERAAGRGVPVRWFPHQDVNALAQLVKQSGGRPVIVSDGICTSCGCAAPVAHYLEVARRQGGLLVLDDTQALGLLGHSPDRHLPYGRGGGGSLRYLGVSGPDVLMVSSLAKAFGTPMAALSGSREMVRRFQASSETRVHCSPPSVVAIQAAAHALQLNVEHGDARRARLARHVQHFRRLLAAAGLKADGGLFPVQTLKPLDHLDAERLHQQLLRLGVRTILRRGCDGSGPQLSFVITARHRPVEIECAVWTIAAAVCKQRRNEGRRDCLPANRRPKAGWRSRPQDLVRAKVTTTQRKGDSLAK